MRTSVLWGGVALSLSLQVWTIVFPSVSIATFDEDKVKALFIKQLSRRHLSDEAIAEKTRLFASHLKQTLHTYAQKKHLVLIPENIVIAGAHDVTTDIIRALSKRARHE
ncbi:MAG: hypothetical protein QG556_117 [Pseudomonadota bacterium]|nr:hypothetical protein [Pseudomonadota bacterium]